MQSCLSENMADWLLHDAALLRKDIERHRIPYFPLNPSDAIHIIPMFNAFKHERELDQQQRLERSKERAIAEDQKRRKRNEAMRSASLNRVSSWASKHLDPQLTFGKHYAVLQDGSVALNHPTQHQFRGSSLEDRVRRMYLSKGFQSALESPKTVQESSPAKGQAKDDRFDAFTLVLPPISEANRKPWMSHHDFNRFGRAYKLDAPWHDPAHYQTSGSPVGHVDIATELRARNKSRELGDHYLSPSAKNAWDRNISPVGSLRAGVSSRFLVKLSPLYEDQAHFKKQSSGLATDEVQLRMRDGKVYRKSLEAFLSHALHKGGVSSSQSLSEQLGAGGKMVL